MKINQISPQNNKFLQILDTIALKPKMLYYYGELPTERVKTVAIVGARKNTQYGEEIAYRLAYDLAKKGVIIVSGLAIGIDAIAHRGAVDAGGKTIGILGTEIERIYPRQNAKLAEEMLELGGAVMSEYKTGDLINYRGSFLARNRLISGLADAVVIVEAAERSGSLNTASHAMNQGRDLFAVPGDITRKMSAGCNNLIKFGAMPYTQLEDLTSILFPAKMEKINNKKTDRSQLALFGDSDDERTIIKALADGMRDGEEIMEKLGMDVSVFNQTITMLEIKGVVRSLGMNNWTLKQSS